MGPGRGMAWRHSSSPTVRGRRRTGLSARPVLLPVRTCLRICATLLALGARASSRERGRCRRTLGTLITGWNGFPTAFSGRYTHNRAGHNEDALTQNISVAGFQLDQVVLMGEGR